MGSICGGDDPRKKSTVEVDEIDSKKKSKIQSHAQGATSSKYAATAEQAGENDQVEDEIVAKEREAAAKMFRRKEAEREQEQAETVVAPEARAVVDLFAKYKQAEMSKKPACSAKSGTTVIQTTFFLPYGSPQNTSQQQNSQAAAAATRSHVVFSQHSDVVPSQKEEDEQNMAAAADKAAEAASMAARAAMHSTGGRSVAQEGSGGMVVVQQTVISDSAELPLSSLGLLRIKKSGSASSPGAAPSPVVSTPPPASAPS